MGLESFFAASSELIWYIAFLILIPIAVSFTIKCKAQQFKIHENAKVVADAESKKYKKSISSFETFLLGLGERVGIGNIVSVAAAIMIGGPGAIFWMWVFAALVAIVSFAETTASQIYKSRREDGIYVGGPTYNATKAFGNEKAGKAIAVLYIAIILILSFTISAMFFEQFEMLQIGSNRTIGAVLFTVVLTIMLIGGMKFIARASMYIVPVMALLWIVLCVAVMIANLPNMGHAFEMIFKYAFTIPEGLTQSGFLSIEGVWEGIKGPIGALLGTVMITGLRRGIFSNDAGIGTVSIISSAADVKHPVKQGLVQSLAVFIDTIVICTCTALVILSFGDWSDIMGLNLNFAPLVTEVISRSLLGDLAKYVMTAFMFVFTITTLMSLMNMLESTAYALNKKDMNGRSIKIVMVVIVFSSCFISSATALNICDTFVAICAITNTIMIFKMRRQILEAFNDYRRQKKEGIDDPEFHSDTLTDKTGVTEWD